MDKTPFQYQLQLCDGYILCTLSGEADLGGYEKATNDLLKLTVESGVRKILYDAHRLDTSRSHSFNKKTIEYFMIVSSRTDRLASYLPELRPFAKAKFFSLTRKNKKLEAVPNTGKGYRMANCKLKIIIR